MKKYYFDYDFYNMKSGKETHIVENFKPLQQEKDNTCGPVCVKMVLNYFGVAKDIDVACLATLCNTRPYPYGTKLKDLVNGIGKVCDCEVVSSLNHPKFECYSDFKSFVIEYLDKGIPIIVENVDYGGHYRVIIGLDEHKENDEKDMLIFADPSDLYDGVQDGYNYFPAERFFCMWFDKSCLEKNAREQPFVIIVPKK